MVSNVKHPKEFVSDVLPTHQTLFRRAYNIGIKKHGQTMEEKMPYHGEKYALPNV